MHLIRNCLTWLGLLTFLSITSCVMGLSSCGRIYNPTRFAQDVNEAPDKTKRMLAGFLSGVESEAPAEWPLRPKATAAAVQEFTDGSLHLTVTGRAAPLMEVVVKVTPAEEGSRVEVFSDARGLAEAHDKVSASELHREIKHRLEDALDAIDGHRVLDRSFTIAALLRDVDRDRW